jgi:hypothetical protein
LLIGAVAAVVVAVVSGAVVVRKLMAGNGAPPAPGKAVRPPPDDGKPPPSDPDKDHQGKPEGKAVDPDDAVPPVPVDADAGKQPQKPGEREHLILPSAKGAPTKSQGPQA